jgi:C-terminal processing protease CtpA/Prc
MSIIQNLLSLVSTEPNGRSVYQKVWQLTHDNLFDVDKLADWKRWQHRFDHQINSHDDAIRYANQALASLGDRYNQVYSQVEDRKLYALMHNPYAVKVKELPGDIGYLHLQDFMPWNTTDQIDRGLCHLRNCNGLVLDLRGNGGGDLEQALDSLGFFLKEGTLAAIEKRVPEAGHMIRKLTLTEDSLITVETDLATRRQSEEKTQRCAFSLKERRLAILVNKHTASAAEMFVAAMQDNGTPIVGSRTCGKGIGQRHLSISEDLGMSRDLGINLQVTNCRYFSPLGAWLGDDGQTVAAGVTPNLVVDKNQDDFEPASAQDNQFQAAIELFASERA